MCNMLNFKIACNSLVEELKIKNPRKTLLVPMRYIIKY